MRITPGCCATAGVALVGAGVVAVTPATSSLPDVRTPDIALSSGEHTDIVIDIVRHGQRMPPFNTVVTPSPDHPGPPLSELGQQQAQDVAAQLHDKLGDQVAGIFSGQAIRDIDTAAPFAALQNMADQVQILPGLNEIDSGIYAGAPLTSLGGWLYELTPLMWSLFGLVLTPIPGSGEDYNGVVFNDKFTDAVQTMYQVAMANPVPSADGHITAVAFNNEADVAAWVAMNVKNPDISFLLPRTLETLFSGNDGYPLLSNGGVIEIEGNPTDGWTLVNWDGHPIPADPGLLTKLLADLRDLIIAPQTAAWHIWEAVLGGDPATIESALHTGIENVGAAIIQFPQSVFNDIADALSNLGADTAGPAASETTATLSDVMAALI